MKKTKKHLKSSAIDSVMSFCQICYIEAQVKGLVFNLLFVQHFYIVFILSSLKPEWLWAKKRHHQLKLIVTNVEEHL